MKTQQRGLERKGEKKREYAQAETTEDTYEENEARVFPNCTRCCSLVSKAASGPSSSPSLKYHSSFGMPSSFLAHSEISTAVGSAIGFETPTMTQMEEVLHPVAFVPTSCCHPQLPWGILLCPC